MTERSCIIPTAEINTIYHNQSRDPATSFKISVDLWVYGKKVQAIALVDSGAQISVINSDFVTANNLLTQPLRPVINLHNADGTYNKAGKIDTLVKAFMVHGIHKETIGLAVTKLSGQDLILGYEWFTRHNPHFDWSKGTISYDRCTKEGKCIHAAKRQRPAKPSEEEADELPDEVVSIWDLPLDTLGEGDSDNPFVNWLSQLEDEDNKTLAQLVAEILKKDEESLDSSSTEKWRSLVPKEYQEFGPTVFSHKASERMPVRKDYDHAIDFVEGATLPKPVKRYPMSKLQQNSLDEWIDEELRKGYIRESKSPIASPVFFVAKKDGSLRMVVDYRKLNEITVQNKYPIPRISELIDQLASASIFTKIDLRWGYNNVRIKEGDEWNTAFITHRGLYEATVMYFGFCNAPGTFQAMMNSVLSDFIQSGKVIVYLDDILIFGNDLKEHRKLVKAVLQRLQDSDLYAKPEKCFFEQKSIEYLGMIISHNSVAMDPKKYEGVLDWPQPTKVKEVQAFLGFANFYRRFIRDFSYKAKPLTQLTHKNQKWAWGEKEQQAFEDLKKAFTSAPILRIPDQDSPFRIESDASDFATGSVLSQLDPKDGLYHPVAYYSKSMTEAERNYEIYDKELLAIIRSLEEWRHYLEGHPNVFEVWTDHANLTYFKTAQKLTRR